MPTAPAPRKRPWISTSPQQQKHQGRQERTTEYDTTRWRKARKSFLSANPLCVECAKEGKVTAANTVDHIKRVNDGGSFWNEDNWQGLCYKHHAKKSAQERHGK